MTEFFPLTAGVKINQIPPVPRSFWAFPAHLEVARHLWTLTEVPGDVAGLLTHSKNVTTSILYRKKTFTTSFWGGMAPVAPLATPLVSTNPSYSKCPSPLEGPSCPRLPYSSLQLDSYFTIMLITANACDNPYIGSLISMGRRGRSFRCHCPRVVPCQE